MARRLTSDRVVLRKGEGQRKNGTYIFRYKGQDGERHAIYAKTLEELREKEEEIAKDTLDDVKTEKRSTTLNDIYKLWCDVKRGLKDNTFQNYKYMYEQFVKDVIGNKRIKDLKKSDIRKFYNLLIEERNLKISTVDSVHTVLHQVLQIAVDDDIIRKNPSDNAMGELKKAHNFGKEKRKALTIEEQKLFLSYLKNNKQYNHWYPIFAVMCGTGLRVGEITGLRWCDIDFEKDEISVNHTLVYYNHAKDGCYFNVNTPKTDAGNRTIDMLDFVKEALLEEKRNQELFGIKCNVSIDGYTDFIFVNRFGNVQHQGTLNKALRRIIRDCNAEILEKNSNAELLLPRFSCHNLRHSFTVRLIEANANLKFVQEILGHKDCKVTLDVYAEATKKLRLGEKEKLENNKDLWGVE